MKIDRETATQDFNRFVGKLKVKERKLKKLEEEKEAVIELIEEGSAIVDESGILTYKLDFPVENDQGEAILSELKFRGARISVDDLEKNLQGNASDMQKARNTLALLTGSNAAYLKKMDGDDYTDIMNSVVAFYLPR
jgi:hypothetical protein